MNKNTAATLILAEQKFGLLTKAFKAKQAFEGIGPKLLDALDAFNGETQEYEIPEGYVLIPASLPSGEKAAAFNRDLGVGILAAKQVYASFVERFSV